MAPPSLEVPVVSLPGFQIPLPLERPELATRAMARFACTRSACPDSCCRDFGIHFDKPSMSRMLTATAHHASDHERIVRLVVLGMPLPQAGKTQVVLDENGSCPMLEKGGDCDLHRRYGEALLPTVCSVFPRTSLALPDRVEVTGTLACPELARLTLLSDDGVHQEETVASLMPRSYIGKSIPVDSELGDDYSAQFLQVRSVLRDLLRNNKFPLSSRLVFTAHLAAEVDSFFHRDSDAFRGAKRQFARQRLTTELSAALSGTLQADLHRDLCAFTAPAEVVVCAVLGLLTERLRLPHPTRFAELVASVLAALGTDSEMAARLEGTTASQNAARVLHQQQDDLELRFPGLTDQILSRFSQHFLLRNPYTDAPSLLHYLGRLSLSLAAIRVLIIGSAKTRPPTDAKAFAEMSVDVIQIFTKAVSHQADFLAAIHRASELGSGMTFGRLVLFAKFHG